MNMRHPGDLDETAEKLVDQAAAIISIAMGFIPKSRIESLDLENALKCLSGETVVNIGSKFESMESERFTLNVKDG